MIPIEQEIRAQLLAAADADYHAFHTGLVPTADPARFLGVRLPAQRKIAKAFAKDPRVAAYLALTHHDYYEEVNIHGFLIDSLADIGACLAAVDALLSQIDNWATCDTLSPRLFKQHPAAVEPAALAWMQEMAAPYTVRFGIVTLMRHFLDTNFRETHLASVAACCSEEYYVNMAVAWYFATALAKQWDNALPWIAEHRLPAWTHRKSIQKAIESYRVTPEQKALLKTYR